MGKIILIVGLLFYTVSVLLRTIGYFGLSVAPQFIVMLGANPQ
jgi:hypothetical protein